MVNGTPPNGSPKPKPTLAAGGAANVYVFKPQTKDITAQELTGCMNLLLHGILVGESMRLRMVFSQGLPVVNQAGQQIGMVPPLQPPSLAPPAVVDACWEEMTKGSRRHFEVVDGKKLAEEQRKMAEQQQQKLAMPKKPGIVLPRG